MNQISHGYQCALCGTWVPAGMGHACSGPGYYPSNPPAPPAWPLTPQPMQFVHPFTLEDVRRVIREELEAFAKKQLDSERSADPTDGSKP